METTTATTSLFIHSLAAPPLPPRLFSGNSILFRKTRAIKVIAARRDANFDGRLVDESMVVLRKRIQEMSAVEKRYEAAPRHWMEWEKRYKKENYDLDVCEAVGYLQSKLMETRPAVALGMGAALLFTLPTSMALLWFHLMPVIKLGL